MPEEQFEELKFEVEPDAALHADNKENNGDVRALLALQMLKQVRDGLTHVIGLLESGETTKATRHMVNFVSEKKNIEETLGRTTGAKIVEGIFDGKQMITSSGECHAVPENYASKSRLVEGDVLKLTIQSDGRHVYKQIGPVNRKRLVGKLAMDADTTQPIVVCKNHTYRVLSVSVTYYKGVLGDDVVVIVPVSQEATWAAVERIG